MAETQLTNLVKHIEYYKIISGRYPSSLEDLQPKNKYDVTGLVFIADPMNKKLNPLKKAIYFYEIINNGTHYLLFSSGIDCVPFTADDVYPNISLAETQKIGYRKKQQ